MLTDTEAQRSADEQMAFTVGSRHGKPIILPVKAGEADRYCPHDLHYCRKWVELFKALSVNRIVKNEALSL